MVTSEHKNTYVIGEKNQMRGSKPVRECGPVCKVLIREELCFDKLVHVRITEHNIADLSDGILHLASGASSAIVILWTATRHRAARAVLDWPMEVWLHGSLHINPAHAIH